MRVRNAPAEALINLWDQGDLRSRHPLLIAHRGGVIAANAPENSLAAIQLAGIHPYDMVELDVKMARDGEPVLFHGTSGQGLYIDCGVAEFIGDLTSEELGEICYRASTERIATLADALALCASLKLGVMLDIQLGEGSGPCLQRIADLLREHGLGKAAVTLSREPSVRQALADQVILRVSDEDVRRVLAGDAVSLDRQYWFAWAAQIPSYAVPLLQEQGAFVIPSINAFHYPAHAHDVLARQDIRRLLAAGVDGFQIDAVYEDCFL
jgi:glycerophosphoryl diester phosphodiesterase